MIEVSVQVLGRSFPGLFLGTIIYKIRSGWCLPVLASENCRGKTDGVRVPGLSLADSMERLKSGEEIPLVVEVWDPLSISSKDGIPFGVALVNVEELLLKPHLNPLMRHFQVVDLIKGVNVGTLFLKVGLSLISSTPGLPAVIPEHYSGGGTRSNKPSAYFSTTPGANPALRCPPHLLEPSPQTPTKEDPRAPAANAPSRPAPPSKSQNVPHSSAQQTGEAPRGEEEIPTSLEKQRMRKTSMSFLLQPSSSEPTTTTSGGRRVSRFNWGAAGAKRVNFADIKEASNEEESSRTLMSSPPLFSYTPATTAKRLGGGEAPYSPSMTFGGMEPHIFPDDDDDNDEASFSFNNVMLVAKAVSVSTQTELNLTPKKGTHRMELGKQLSEDSPVRKPCSPLYKNVTIRRRGGQERERFPGFFK